MYYTLNYAKLETLNLNLKPFYLTFLLNLFHGSAADIEYFDFHAESIG